jgi:hypothetical protein
MHRILRVSILVAIIAVSASWSLADTFVETFDSGNEGGWTYGGPGESIVGAGGNPGAYLDSGILDTFAAQLRTSTASNAFVGNYRAMGVTGVGVDLIQILNTTTTGGRPCTLMLIYDNGTPADPLDDTAAYFLGPNIPDFGDGWLSYEYPVPSADVALPPGWLLLNLGDSGAPPNHDWDTVIQNVSKTQFFYGDPTFFFIFQQWVVGADNVRITTGEVTCGNGTIDPDETCDPPGDPAGGNGNDCRSDCTVCGDGEVNGAPGLEECDDGDGDDNDLCSNSCTINQGGDVPATSTPGLLALIGVLLAGSSLLLWRRRQVG